MISGSLNLSARVTPLGFSSLAVELVITESENTCWLILLSLFKFFLVLVQAQVGSFGVLARSEKCVAAEYRIYRVVGGDGHISVVFILTAALSSIRDKPRLLCLSDLAATEGGDWV